MNMATRFGPLDQLNDLERKRYENDVRLMNSWSALFQKFGRSFDNDREVDWNGSEWEKTVCSITGLDKGASGDEQTMEESDDTDTDDLVADTVVSRLRATNTVVASTAAQLTPSAQAGQTAALPKPISNRDKPPFIEQLFQALEDPKWGRVLKRKLAQIPDSPPPDGQMPERQCSWSLPPPLPGDSPVGTASATRPIFQLTPASSRRQPGPASPQLRPSDPTLAHLSQRSCRPEVRPQSLETERPGESGDVGIEQLRERSDIAHGANEDGRIAEEGNRVGKDKIQAPDNPCDIPLPSIELSETPNRQPCSNTRRLELVSTRRALQEKSRQYTDIHSPPRSESRRGTKPHPDVRTGVQGASWDDVQDNPSPSLGLPAPGSPVAVHDFYAVESPQGMSNEKPPRNSSSGGRFLLAIEGKDRATPPVGKVREIPDSQSPGYISRLRREPASSNPYAGVTDHVDLIPNGPETSPLAKIEAGSQVCLQSIPTAHRTPEQQAGNIPGSSWKSARRRKSLLVLQYESSCLSSSTSIRTRSIPRYPHTDGPELRIATATPTRHPWKKRRIQEDPLNTSCSERAESTNAADDIPPVASSKSPNPPEQPAGNTAGEFGQNAEPGLETLSAVRHRLRKRPSVATYNINALARVAVHTPRLSMGKGAENSCNTSGASLATKSSPQTQILLASSPTQSSSESSSRGSGFHFESFRHDDQATDITVPSDDVLVIPTPVKRVFRELGIKAKPTRPKDIRRNPNLSARTPAQPTPEATGTPRSAPNPEKSFPDLTDTTAPRLRKSPEQVSQNQTPVPSSSNPRKAHQSKTRTERIRIPPPPNTPKLHRPEPQPKARNSPPHLLAQASSSTRTKPHSPENLPERTQDPPTRTSQPTNRGSERSRSDARGIPRPKARSLMITKLRTNRPSLADMIGWGSEDELGL